MRMIGSTLLVLAFGVITGALVSPLLAQPQNNDPQRVQCFVGEGSNAACSGSWIYFAGNTSALDSGAWLIGINSETGEIRYKDGKRIATLEERD